jgi:hypothetical protein
MALRRAATVLVVSGERSGMRTMPSGAPETGIRLADISGFSLIDLANMDDFSVADILDGLIARGRCGIGAEQRYVANRDITE